MPDGSWLPFSAGPILLGDQIPGGKTHGYLAIVFGTMVIFLSGFAIFWFIPGKRTEKYN